MPGYNHEKGSFQGKGSLKIHFQRWLCDKPKCILVVSHGIGGHSGRYEHLVDAFDGRNVSVYALDHRGHGDSEGKRGHVDSFLDYVYDLKFFMNMIKNAHPSLPVFLIGHSMGGAIALRFALTYQKDIAGLILCGVAVKPIVNKSNFAMTMFNFASKFASGATIESGLDAALLSHDKAEVDKYLADPKIHGKISFHLASELFRNAQFCLDRADEIRIPLLLIHGRDDKICDFKGSEALFEKAKSLDKKIIIYDGLYHEIMNEVEKERMKVLNDVKNWVRSKVSGGQTSGKSVAVEQSDAKKAAPKKAAKKAVKKAVKKAAPKKAVKKAAPKKAVKKAAPKKAVKKSGK